MNSVNITRIRCVIILLISSVILTLPQIISSNMIIGSDSIFHFNRFYETAQQIKTGHYNYFMSIYGFQQTGRIIVPLYSPIFSYLFGGILLLCGTWYMFQLVSNFLLFFCAGLFLFIFLLKLNVTKELSLKFSLVYMTTYAVSYWVIRQGYSSWGAFYHYV